MAAIRGSGLLVAVLAPRRRRGLALHGVALHVSRCMVWWCVVWWCVVAVLGVAVREQPLPAWTALSRGCSAVRLALPR